MSKQLYNVGDNIVTIKDGNDLKLQVVDITSEEGKSGTYWIYHLMLDVEVQEKNQEDKGQQVADEQNKKLGSESPEESPA